MVITPLLLIVVSQLTYLFTSQVQDFAGHLGAFESFTVSVVVKLVSFAIIWAMFSVIYSFLPNTPIRFISAMSAGVVGGTIFIISWWALFNLQIGISKYNAIYGSFLAFPMLLFWLHISWMILLFGAEYSFAHQNVETYEYEPQSLHVSHSLRKLLMLRIMDDIVKKFTQGETPWKPDDLAHHLNLPIRLVNQILHELVGCSLLSRVYVSGEEHPAYQPARDPAQLTIKEIVDIWERHGKDEIEYKKGKELARISEVLQDFNDTVERSSRNISIKDL
jgi:membrane protein